MSRFYTAATFPPTLNREAIDALPVYKLPPTYSLGEPGMGCFMDPPGFPTYFMRPVYNAHGNTPRNAPSAVLLGSDGKLRRFERPRNNTEAGETYLRKFYVPLAVDHPRVAAWILDVGRHWGKCYKDPTATAADPHRSTFVFPIPAYDRLSPEEKARRTALATVDNHQGVRIIRRFYPAWSPDDIKDPQICAWLSGGLTGHPFPVALWYTTDETPPAPGACPGDLSVRFAHTDRHCQWCGGLGNTPAPVAA